MVDDATNPETLRRLAEETRRLREGVALITFAWANVENAMAMLLHAILRDDQGRFSSAIYFTPSAIETRFNIVNKAFHELLDGTPVEKELSEVGSKIFSKLQKLKETRNKVAHGQVVTSGSLNGKNHVRLMHPIFNVQKSREAFRAGQLAGLTASDLEKHLAIVSQLVTRLEVLRSIVDLIHEGDFATWRQKVPELTADLHRATNPQSDAPNSPVPQSRPRSSRE
jgi:hypothetical protein